MAVGDAVRLAGPSMGTDDVFRRRGGRLVIRNVGVGDSRFKLGLPGSPLAQGYLLGGNMEWALKMLAWQLASEAQRAAQHGSFSGRGPGQSDGLRGPRDVCRLGVSTTQRCRYLTRYVRHIYGASRHRCRERETLASMFTNARTSLRSRYVMYIGTYIHSRPR